MNQLVVIFRMFENVFFLFLLLDEMFCEMCMLLLSVCCAVSVSSRFK